MNNKKVSKLYAEHLDSQTVYNENGDIKTSPASYDLDKNVAPEVTKYRATVTVQENGTVDIRADRPSGGPRYETVYSTAHATVQRRVRLPKHGSTETTVCFKFRRGEPTALVAECLTQETIEIMKYLTK